MTKKSLNIGDQRLGQLLYYKGHAFYNLERFPEARVSALESLTSFREHYRDTRFFDDDGRVEFTDALLLLAGIASGEGDFLAQLAYAEEGSALLHRRQPERFGLLYIQASALERLGRFSEALVVCEESMQIALELFGPVSTELGATCKLKAFIFGDLKDFGRALKAIERAIAISTETHGPLAPETIAARQTAAVFQQELSYSPIELLAISKETSVCSTLKCKQIGSDQCSFCNLYFVCNEHEEEICEHVFVCPKFPDDLPGDEELKKIVKCRRCRKETKLMKCSVCEKVSYCGASCQKEDWKRHKVFCGKK